jgi:DNA repair exonuclease SbcCD ATPase subunit
MAADAEIDALYKLPLADFVPERNALSKRLKDAGEAERAAEVKGLAKPSLAAWAINQLARRETAKVSALLKAGERLRQEQAKVLRGDSPDALQSATAHLRDATQELLAAARQLLSEGGDSASDAMLDRIAGTLRAGAVDDTGRDLLERGRLTRELEHTGFDVLASLGRGGGEPRRPKAAAPARSPAATRRLEQAEAAVSALRSTVRDLAEEVERAQREAVSARRLAEKAARHLRAEQEHLERAKRNLSGAEEKLTRLAEAKNA